METWIVWLALCLAGLILLGEAALVAVVVAHCKGVVNSLQPVLLKQLELVDKSTAIAAAADLAGYQGIQVMNQLQPGYDESYDPSDEAAARREAERQGLTMEEYGDADNDALNALFT